MTAHSSKARIGVPLLSLSGVVSAEDLGPWIRFDACFTQGRYAGRTIERDHVYGLRRDSDLLEVSIARYACGECDDTYETVFGVLKHYKNAHGPRKRMRDRRRELARVDRAVEAVKTSRPVVDEDGLDLAAPAVLEGVAAIIASRAHWKARAEALRIELAARIAELEALRFKLSKIRTVVEE